MKNLWTCFVLCLCLFNSCRLLAEEKADESPTLIVVCGAPGTEEYAKEFGQWLEQWKQVAEQGKVGWVLIGSAKLSAGDSASETSDRQRLEEALKGAAKRESAELWLVLIGHGTYDRRQAKFNLEGPDVSAEELAEWLKPMKRPLVVVNCTSSSGPFLPVLSGENRAVISATRSGAEQNFARFGKSFVQAFLSKEADQDQDGQVSLLEAYLAAARLTARFYQDEGRLATEHPLLDDNGDRLGTPPDWYQGLRAIRKAKTDATSDGLRAHQLHLIPSVQERELPASVRLRRNTLELQIAQLRDRKQEMMEAEYYDELEMLLIELAQLYESTTNSKESPNGDLKASK